MQTTNTRSDDPHDDAEARPPIRVVGVPLDERWEEVQTHLRAKVKREQYETWFRRTALLAVEESVVRIAVHNGFVRDWLRDYYDEVIRAVLEEVLGSPRTIDFVIDPERTAPPATERAPFTPGSHGSGEVAPPEPAKAAPAGAPAQGTAPGGLADPPRQPGTLLGGSDVTLNPKYRFETFVVGPCNRFAHAACTGVAEKPGQTYNPLFLHGSVGLGKTHLLQSLCHSVLERTPESRILFLSCETFVNHFISALQNGDLTTFRHKYRNVDVLVVDDIHLLANKERTQEEFFHTFNTLYNAGKQIVLSSDSPPLEIPSLQERLVSRFKWGLVTEMETPCYETRVAILKRKSRDRSRELPDEVARFLAERIDTNIRELEGAVTKILGYSALSGQEPSLQMVRQCLQELFTTRRGPASIEDILTVVTERMNVKRSDLQSKKRTNAIAYPRQIAMFLARTLTRMSLEEIGGYFGGRDHSTVLYAVQKITKLEREDPSLRTLLAEFVLELQSDGPA